MTDDLLSRLSGFIPRMLRAVQERDYDDLTEAYARVQAEVGVPGGHALAVALAETLLIEREQHRAQLARLNGEVTKYAEAYLDQQRRVRELREILDARAAAVPTQAKARVAA